MKVKFTGKLTGYTSCSQDTCCTQDTCFWPTARTSTLSLGRTREETHGLHTSADTPADMLALALVPHRWSPKRTAVRCEGLQQAMPACSAPCQPAASHADRHDDNLISRLYFFLDEFGEYCTNF
jgi:hypothetical protein